jgi:hypothetical protein
MRGTLFALAALTALGAAASWLTVAQARDYPWCAQYNERTSGGQNCGFVTFAQCQAAISGVGGFCQPNPRYTTGRGYRHERHRTVPYYRD